ncbi:MAG: carboxypeptidase regulatory-like domain-containing protein, partial [Planctomycetes bacterium]|nr:carboxypeptidase regulatory-like domain-containing protein [Planctomycetota bacterium]
GKTGATMKLNGIVLLPDGKPAEAGQITLHYRYMSGMGSGSWGSGIAKDGKFNFSRTWNNDDMRDMEPFRLTLQMPGCKPKTVDLTKEGLNLENLEIRLEKQSFGQARIVVTDLEGQPLRGARITPVTNAYRQRYYGQRTPPRTKSTNEKGEAYFTGLATGKRAFTVELDGYFLDEPAELDVLAEGEAQLTVKLRPTLAIKGKVALPGGFEAAKVVLCLQAMENDYQTVRTSGVDAGGRFGFDGLPPGKYQIFTNHPKLALATQGVVELTDKDAETEVKLAPAGGVKLDLGAANKRANIWLSEPGRWDPGAKKEPQNIYGGPAWANADQAGRAEVFGLQPGTYDLVLTPTAGSAGYNAQHKTRARLVVRDVAVPALAGGYDDLEKAAGTPIKLPAGDAALRGVLAMKGEWKDMENNNISIGSLQVHVVGAQAVGSQIFNLPQDFMANREPILVGNLPASCKPAKPNEFSMEGLPPGEYRIYTEVNAYNRTGRRGRALRMQAGMGGAEASKGKKEEPAPKLVKTVTVEAGKTLDLGEVEFDLPLDVKEKVAEEMAKQFEMNYGGETGEDEPEVAKP